MQDDGKLLFLLGESYWRKVDGKTEVDDWWLAKGVEDCKILSFPFVLSYGGFVYGWFKSGHWVVRLYEMEM